MTRTSSAPYPTRRVATFSRRALTGVLAVMVLVLTSFFGLPQEARAFTPAVVPVSSGSAPTVVVDVSHSPTAPDPKQGEAVNYSMTFTFGGLGTEAGSTNSTRITVTADSNAPFSSDPSLNDFKWGGVTTPTGSVESGCSTTSCTFLINSSSMQNGTLTFTKAATVKAGLGDGTIIAASASASIDTKPTPVLQNVSATPLNGQCSGPYTFKQKVGPSGVWLADIKFGDLAGEGKVFLTPGDRTILSWNDQNPTSDMIKFVNASGENITSDVMADATYLANDPTVPYYLANPGLVASDPNTLSQYATTSWADSLNWPYDPSTFTGTTWLPAGTEIIVQRQVTYANCLPGGFSTSTDTSREFGISTQVARANTTVSASDQDIFTMPGQRPPASCVDKMFISMNANNSPTTFYQWDPTRPIALETLGSETGRTDAIAAHQDREHIIWAVDHTNATLYVWDTQTGTRRNLNATGWGNAGTTALGFTKEGALWVATRGGKTAYLTPQEVNDAFNGSAVQWHAGPELVPSAGALSGIADIAFDSAGTMYVSYNNSGGAYSSTQLIGTVSSTALGSTTTATIQQKASIGEGLYFRGLAFLGDKLYMGKGLVGNTTNTTELLYTVDWKGTWAIKKVANSGAKGLSDFASCSYGEPVAPSGPKFAVQKAIVNEDGTLAPAGTTGTNRTLGADGTLTIDYWVVVSNIGSAAGTHPIITDNVSVPTGFTVTEVLLNGVKQNSNSNFTIAGTELNPNPTSTSAPAYKAYKVTVKARLADMTAGLNGNIDWAKAAVCNTTGGGTPSAGGFFNYVTMPGDADVPGVANNDACAPITPPSTLTLIKQIVDQNGTVISTSTDSKYFTLLAAGPMQINGSSPTSGTNAVSSKVPVGTYLLGEFANLGQSGNESGLISGQYEPYGLWTCEATSGTLKFDQAKSSVTLAANDNVKCTVKNVKTPKVHIVKTATSPSAENAHIGTPVQPNADGTFTANYTMTVTNTTGSTINTGAIADRFVPPAGVVWDGTKTATVTFNPGTTGATAVGVPTSVTRAQLASEAILATAINNLPDNAPVTFTISIPLKTDLTPTSSGTTIYQDNLSTLSQCESINPGSITQHTTANFGIPNVVRIDNEDHSYSDISVEDNIACIPISPAKMHIVKTAADPISGNPHIGKTIKVNPDGTFVASYLLTVTNTSAVTADAGIVRDRFPLPAGIVWDGTKTATITYNAMGTGATTVGAVSAVTEAQLTAGVDIAQAIKGIPADGSVSFRIDIPLKLDSTIAPGATQTNYQANSTNLAVCTPLKHSAFGGYTNDASGLPNTTSLAGEDQTYSQIWYEDNVACVPLDTTELWRVEKAAANAVVNGTATEWADAGTTGAEVKVNDDGTVQVFYKVKVTNESDFPAPHPAIYDQLTLPAGFSFTSATLNGAPLTTTANGQVVSFNIPAGTAALLPQASAEYVIVLDAKANDLTTVDWTKAATCNTEGVGTPADGGFFNAVTLNGDSDGAENNDACVPVTPPTKIIKLEKLGLNCDVDKPSCPLAGAEFAIYDEDPLAPGSTAQPLVDGFTLDAPTGAATDGSTFTSIPLGLGDYWIVETKAPSGFGLLAKPIKISVTPTGLVIDPAEGLAQVKPDDPLTLQVFDVPDADLPATGGNGPIPFAVVGFLLLAMAGVQILRTTRPTPVHVDGNGRGDIRILAAANNRD